MKKVSIFSLLALALAIGASAFTTPSHTAKTTTVLYWFVDPNDGSTYQGDNSAADEQTATGCNGSQAICEKGYTSGQLQNPAIPGDGVKAAELNNFTPVRQQ